MFPITPINTFLLTAYNWPRAAPSTLRAKRSLMRFEPSRPGHHPGFLTSQAPPCGNSLPETAFQGLATGLLSFPVTSIIFLVSLTLLFSQVVWVSSCAPFSPQNSPLRPAFAKQLAILCDSCQIPSSPWSLAFPLSLSAFFLELSMACKLWQH